MSLSQCKQFVQYIVQTLLVVVGHTNCRCKEFAHYLKRSLLYFAETGYRQCLGQPSFVLAGTLLLNFFCNDVIYEVQTQGHPLMRVIPYVGVIAIAIFYWVGKYLWAHYLHRRDRAIVESSRNAVNEIVEDMTSGPRSLVAMHPRDPARVESSRNAVNEIVVDTTSGPRSLVAMGSNSQTQIQSRVVLTISNTGNVIAAVVCNLQPDQVLPGSKLLYKRLQVKAQSERSEWENLRSQIIHSMRLAYKVDKDCTLQLDSFAILKFTDSGPKTWMLREDWTPTILDISRSPWGLSNYFYDCSTWTVKGLNLQNAALRMATSTISKDLTVFHYHKMKSGIDVVVCKEPILMEYSAPRFQEQVYISASKVVEVEEGVIMKLQSGAQNVRRAFWMSVFESLIPSPWTLTVMASLSLLGGLEHGHGRYGLLSILVLQSLDLRRPGEGMITTDAFFCCDDYEKKISEESIMWSDIWSHLRSDFEFYKYIYLVYFIIIAVLQARRVLFVLDSRRVLDSPRGRSIGRGLWPGSHARKIAKP